MGCSSSPRPEPTTVVTPRPTPSRPAPAEPVVPPSESVVAPSLPTDAPPADSDAVHARDHLGQSTVLRIETATRLDVARLHVVAAREAEQQTLQSLDRIVGYRVDGRVRAAAAGAAHTLTDLVLSDVNYSAVVARCANQSFVGVRFEQGGQRVEFALGLPCNQAIFAWQAGGRITRWGSVMKPDAAAQVVAAADAVLHAAP